MIRPNEAHPPVSVGDLVSWMSKFDHGTKHFVVASIERDGPYYEVDLIGTIDGRGYGAAWLVGGKLDEWSIVAKRS